MCTVETVGTCRKVIKGEQQHWKGAGGTVQTFCFTDWQHQAYAWELVRNTETRRLMQIHQ